MRLAPQFASVVKALAVLLETLLAFIAPGRGDQKVLELEDQKLEKRQKGPYQCNDIGKF